jgi:hypothetical protein
MGDLAPIPVSLERRLIPYYCRPGNRVVCVVTDEHPTWHHLDGQHNHHVIGNVIPLSPFLNSHLSGLGKKGTGSATWLDPLLKPERLVSVAEDKFAKWYVAEAFGCAHLAFHVSAEVYAPRPSAWRLGALRRALYFVRQRFNREIIEYLVEFELMPTLQQCASRLEPAERQLTLQEISTLLSEQGESRSAFGISEILITNPDMSIEQQASLKRRQAHNFGLDGDNQARVDRLLAESGEIAGNDLNQYANRLNTQAFVGLLGESKERIDQTYEMLLECYRRLRRKTETGKRVAMTASNAAAIMLNYAVYESLVRSTGWIRKRDRAAALARRQFWTAGSGLWLQRAGYWDHVLRLMGGHTDDLGELGQLIVELQRESLSPKTVGHLEVAAKMLLG